MTPTEKWTVEPRKLSEIKPYEKNPRRITEKGLNDLVKSLELFGLAEPIVVNLDDTIIGGHARVQALKRIKGKAAAVRAFCAANPSRMPVLRSLRHFVRCEEYKP